jgi:uncharacterized protein YbjT (DUF2867 family)
MRLVVFGATGSIGRHLVEQALASGHEVTAFSRSARTPSDAGGSLRILRGDVLAPDAVAQAVAGQQAVLCSLGAGLKGRVRAEGTSNIVAAMRHHGAKRLVCQTTLGVGDSWSNLNFRWKYVMFGLLLRAAYRDHVRQEEIVRRSGLDWTIVRPSAFTDAPADGPVRSAFPPGTRDLALTVPRAEVARFMLSLIDDPQSHGRAIGLSS